MQTLTAPVLYIAGNYNIDLIMGTLAHWPAPGTEVMLEHDSQQPGLPLGPETRSQATVKRSASRQPEVPTEERREPLKDGLLIEAVVVGLREA